MIQTGLGNDVDDVVDRCVGPQGEYQVNVLVMS